MTVGQPETNLNTWGLRYVKKKMSKGSQQITGREADAGGKTNYTLGGGGFSGVGGAPTETSNIISDADLATPDSPKHITGTQGSDKRRTYGADRKERNQQYDIPPTKKLTPSGRSSNKDPQNPEGVASGAEASHDSGIQSIETRTGKNRSGVKVDPEKKTTPARRGVSGGDTLGGGQKGSKGATPKTAALDLAIIKCKLLKMNGIIKVEGFKITPKGEIGEKTDKKETPKAAEYTKEEHAKQVNTETAKYPMYKSEDIVSKAVELINTAYDEMNKGATIISERSVGRGKPFCSNCGRDHDKEDAKSIAADKEDPTLMVSGTGGGGKPSCPSCGHRPNKKADGGTATTSTEGTTNFVYSDVHEAKKQDKEGKKNKKTAEEIEEERYIKEGKFVSDTYVDDKGNTYAPKDQV